MRVLETRTDKLGIVRRRYSDGSSNRTTYELPATVVKAIGMAKVREEMAKWRRGEALRERAALLREAVAKCPDWKATALANHLNVTEARVRQIRKELAGAR